jgi:arylsulfatase A-like enzyme
MDRRDALKFMGGSLAVLTTPGFFERHAKAATKPNVLFIAIDDLNDWCGCLGGHPQAITPNIDRLAARGVNFRNAYCSAPLCNPSRASLLTGYRPSTSSIYLNSEDWRVGFLSDAVTLPQYFMNNGYRVEGGGKIYHGAYPHAASWHEYATSIGNPSPPSLPGHGIPDMGNVDWGPLDVPDEDMNDYHIAQWGADKLRGKAYGDPTLGADTPFFLAVGIYRPHLPWYAPRKYFDMHPLNEIVVPDVKTDDLDDIPAEGAANAKTSIHNKILAADAWPDAVQAYLACGTFADTCVGVVLDALDDSPYADNTIVVLWGDHGWHLGEKTSWKKFTLWEEATKNPFMMVAPGVSSPNSLCDSPVSLLNVYPTLLDLCGLAPKAENEGQTLRPLLANPKAPWHYPAITTYKEGNHSVRCNGWRYTLYKGGGEELYDHVNDPMEWDNQATNPEYDSVKQALKEWLPPGTTPSPPSVPPPPVSDDAPVQTPTITIPWWGHS